MGLGSESPEYLRAKALNRGGMRIIISPLRNRGFSVCNLHSWVTVDIPLERDWYRNGNRQDGPGWRW